MTLSYLYDGAAITHNIAPSTVSIASAAEVGEAAMSGLNIEDPAADLAILGHRPFIIEESACTQPRLFTGWTTERTVGRDIEAGMFVGGPPRVHDVTIIDLNALFNFRVISGTDGKRPEETGAQRLAWLLASDYLTGLIEDTGFVDASALPGTMEAADYRGSYASAVLGDIVERTVGQTNYFAFWDVAHTPDAVGLWLGHLDDAISTSTLRISNVVADIDSTTTFAPDPGARLSITPTETYSEVIVNYKHDGSGRLFRSRSSTATKYIRRGTTITRPWTGSETTASSQAEKWLDEHASEEDRISVTIIVPAAAAGLLVAGQRLDVKFSHLTGYTTFTSMRCVRLTVTPTNDLATHYSMAMELLAPRPAATPGGTCEDLTPDGSYWPMGSGTSDATGNVIYSKPGVADIVEPTPGFAGSWHFPEYGAGGPGTVDTFGSGVSNRIRCIVVGAGTITVRTTDTHSEGFGIVARLQHLGPETDIEEYATAGHDFVFTVPADGYCTHWVDVTEDGVDAGPLGFAGFDWVGGEVDTEIILPPPPGATITAASDPTVNDDVGDSYLPGQLWINTATNQTFVLVDNTLGAAVWVNTTSGGTGFVTVVDGGKETVSTVAASGATETLDLASGNIHDLTLTADCTLTFAGATAGVACSFTLLLRQDGTGGWTTTWPGSVAWAGGTAPTLDETASTVEVLTFFTLDGGTVWYGFTTGAGGVAGGTPALTFGTTNAAGAAATGVLTDATIAIFDATAPTTAASSDTAATGSAAFAARRDHRHGMPQLVGDLLVADSPLPVPRGTFSTTANQTVASTTTAYAVALATDDLKIGLTHSTVTNNSRIYIDQAGTYSIIVSAIADDTAADKTHLALWLAVDGTNVANSNTVVEIATKETEVVVAVASAYDFTAGQYFELMYRGDATTTRFLQTAAGSSPTRPASPAVIVAVNMEAPAVGALTNGPTPLLLDDGSDFIYADA